MRQRRVPETRMRRGRREPIFSVTLQSVRPQVMSFTVPPRGVTSRTTSWGGSSGRAERRRASKSSEGASGAGAGEAVGSRSSGG